MPRTSHAVGGLYADKRAAVNATGGKKSGLERVLWWKMERKLWNVPQVFQINCERTM